MAQAGVRDGDDKALSGRPAMVGAKVSPWIDGAGGKKAGSTSTVAVSCCGTVCFLSSVLADPVAACWVGWIALGLREGLEGGAGGGAAIAALLAHGVDIAACTVFCWLAAAGGKEAGRTSAFGLSLSGADWPLSAGSTVPVAGCGIGWTALGERWNLVVVAGVFEDDDEADEVPVIPSMSGTTCMLSCCVAEAALDVLLPV